jgi:5-hydroxyisourate hydrolase
MSDITTHVLDLSSGTPAAGVRVHLEVKEKAGWKSLSRGETDADGRLRLASAAASPGEDVYRLTFETGAYFHARKIECLYPEVCIIFHARGARERYHIPLLLSPFGYSTYRGS